MDRKTRGNAPKPAGKGSRSATEGGGRVLGTREAVARWRKRDPEATAAAIARGIGVTDQAVRNHLEALGLPTRTKRSDSLKGSQLADDAGVRGTVLRRIDAAITELREIRKLVAG